MFSKYGRAGIAFLFGVVPVGFVSRQVQLYLSGLKLGFLQAEKVCVKVPEGFLKALAGGGTQTVDIP
jgi:hypothetical protein